MFETTEGRPSEVYTKWQKIPHTDCRAYHSYIKLLCRSNELVFVRVRARIRFSFQVV